MEDQIWLIAEEWRQNEFGGQQAVEVSTPVLALVQSVTRAEWAQAGQIGLQPQLVAITPKANYMGQSVVQVGGKRYGVYRTYTAYDSDDIELYLEEKVGDKTPPVSTMDTP